MSNSGYIIQQESQDLRTLYVRVYNSFDFRIQRDFRKVCQSRRYTRYVIDLDGIGYIDSAALGMLLVLYRYVGEDSRAVKLVHCEPAVLEILRIARFERFFEIQGLGGYAAAMPDFAFCYGT